MTRKQIFEQEIALILTLINTGTDSISYNSTDGHTITMTIEDDIKPSMIKAISQRYGDDYIIRSPSGLRTQIVVDISDLLKDAEPEKQHVVLHPFDKVLVRTDSTDVWWPKFLGIIDPELSGPYQTIDDCGCTQCIPYNEDTKHLVNTSDPCPINYEIEFKK